MEDNLFFLAGIEKCKKGDFAGAIPSFTQALKQLPQHVPSLYNRGLAQLKLSNFHEAIKDFEQALLQQPQNATIIAEKAVALHLLGKHTEALAAFDQALALEPQNPFRYSSRAFVKAKVKDIDGAIADYQQALALDPNDAVAQNNLGLLEEQLGYKQQATQRFRKADALTADEKEALEKPDIDALIAEHKAEQAAQQLIQEEKAKALQGTPAQPTSEAAPKTSDYVGVIKSIFTSKSTFNEFLQFIRNGFKAH